MNDEKVEVKSKKGSSVKMFTLGVLSLVVVVGIFGVILSVRATKNISQNSVVLSVADFLNLPVAKVNGKKILYSDYIGDLKTLKNFYEKQSGDVPPFTDEQISDQVMSRLIINSIVSDVAKEYGATVSEEDIAEVEKQLLAPYSTKADAEADLMDLYGWTLDEYKTKIVRPLVLERNLQKLFSENVDEKNEGLETLEQVKASHILFEVKDEAERESQKNAAEAVLKRALAGEDFGALATEFGSDATKDVGGDLGWFGRGAMVAEFEEAIFALPEGEVSSELVQTQFGFHIVKLDGKRMVNDFVSFMDNKLKTADIDILVSVRNPFEQQDEINLETDEPSEI